MKTRSSRAASCPGTPNQEEIKARNLETYGSRIKAFRKKAGLSAEALADTLGISKSSVRNWECGLTRPDPEYLYRMFSILNVEPNEFFGIRGVGTLLTERERSLLEDYRSLDARGRQDLEIFARSMSERSYIRKLNSVYRSMGSVPDYGRHAAAGTYGCEWPDHPLKEKVILFSSPLLSRADEVIRISGESMAPRFNDGDRVLIEYGTELQNGDIGIFYVPGIGGVIKQKAYDRLHSLNPDYDDIFPYAEGAKLVGRVLMKIDDTLLPTREQLLLFAEAEAEKNKNPDIFDQFEEF